MLRQENAMLMTKLSMNDQNPCLNWQSIIAVLDVALALYPRTQTGCRTQSRRVSTSRTQQKKKKNKLHDIKIFRNVET